MKLKNSTSICNFFIDCGTTFFLFLVGLFNRIITNTFKLNQTRCRCLMQGYLLLCEEGESEKGKGRVRCQVHFCGRKEESLGPPRDGAAVWAGQREDSLFPWCLWEEECGSAHHRVVSFQCNVIVYDRKCTLICCIYHAVSVSDLYYPATTD